MDSHTVKVFSILWNAITLIFNAFCWRFASNKFGDGKPKNDTIHIQSICASSIIRCCFSVVTVSLSFTYILPNFHTHLLGFVITLSLYFGMVILSIQRFLVIYFHLNYELSCFKQNERKIVIISWLFCGFLYLLFISLHKLQNIDRRRLQFVITQMLILSNMFTVAVFLVAYCYIYYKFRRLKNNVRRVIFNKQQKKQIFIPFFIILSFIMFGTIPHFARELTPTYYHRIIWIGADSFANAIVLVILDKRIRNNIKQRFKYGERRIQPNSNRKSNNKHISFILKKDSRVSCKNQKSSIEGSSKLS